MKGVRLTVLVTRSFQFNPGKSWSEAKGKSNTFFPEGCVSASYSCLRREHFSTGAISPPQLSMTTVV